MAQSIMSERWKRKACEDEVKLMLGLRPKQKLPIEGMHSRIIQGMEVWVNPQQPLKPGERKRSTHRVYARCTGCARAVPVGRLHQHKCKTAPSTAVASDQGTFE